MHVGTSKSSQIKYFVIKSRDLKSVSHSVSKGVWAVPIRKFVVPFSVRLFNFRNEQAYDALNAAYDVSKFAR